MAMEIPSSFHKFKMGDQEAVAASVLTSMQQQHIHNLRADVAETILTLEDDVDSPLKSLKERARLQGQLDAYAGLINLSDAANTILSALNSGN